MLNVPMSQDLRKQFLSSFFLYIYLCDLTCIVMNCGNFLRLPRAHFLWATRLVPWKGENAYPAGAFCLSSSFYGVWGAHLYLFPCVCYFDYFVFYEVYINLWCICLFALFNPYPWKIIYRLPFDSWCVLFPF